MIELELREHGDGLHLYFQDNLKAQDETIILTPNGSIYHQVYNEDTEDFDLEDADLYPFFKALLEREIAKRKTT